MMYAIRQARKEFTYSLNKVGEGRMSNITEEEYKKYREARVVFDKMQNMLERKYDAAANT